MTDGPNYGHLLIDEASGLPFIIDRPTGRRQFKLPYCLLCGAVPWSFTAKVLTACGCCGTAMI